MATFRGDLEVEGEPESSIVADVDVSEGRITLRGGGAEIGDWLLNDITIEEADGAFRIVAEDEALLLRVRDPKRFAGIVGVGLSPNFDNVGAPIVKPGAARRTPATPRNTDDSPGASSGVEDPEPPPRPDRPGPDETPLARHLSWALVGAAVVLWVGATLDWGPVRLTNSNFPIERVLVVLAGFAAFAAAYLGLALEKRRDVALVAMLSGVIAVLVIVAFSRRAGIGYGFIVTILGTVAVISIAVVALSHLGAPPPDSHG